MSKKPKASLASAREGEKYEQSEIFFGWVRTWFWNLKSFILNIAPLANPPAKYLRSLCSLRILLSPLAEAREALTASLYKKPLQDKKTLPPLHKPRGDSKIRSSQSERRYFVGGFSSWSFIKNRAKDSEMNPNPPEKYLALLVFFSIPWLVQWRLYQLLIIKELF